MRTDPPTTRKKRVTVKRRQVAIVTGGAGESSGLSPMREPRSFSSISTVRRAVRWNSNSEEAIRAVSRVVANEWAADNINANVISPLDRSSFGNILIEQKASVTATVTEAFHFLRRATGGRSDYCAPPDPDPPPDPLLKSLAGNASTSAVPRYPSAAVFLVGNRPRQILHRNSPPGSSSSPQG